MIYDHLSALNASWGDKAWALAGFIPIGKFIKGGKIIAKTGEEVLEESNKIIKSVKKENGNNYSNYFDKNSATKGTPQAPKAKPEQVHHFATNKSKTYTPQIEKITKQYGLDLDEAWNKQLMPHQGRHPNAYHEYVLENLKQFDAIAIGDKGKVLEIIREDEARN